FSSLINGLIFRNFSYVNGKLLHEKGVTRKKVKNSSSEISETKHKNLISSLVKNIHNKNNKFF
ncbi:MAG: hypothetical protein K2O36_02970, partial [Ruminococcus sp.]|nr:hypothetical protein [Ruminococcus sp.]